MSRISVATSKTVVRGSGVSVARAVSRSRACASGLASVGGGRGIDGAGEADEAGVLETMALRLEPGEDHALGDR